MKFGARRILHTVNWPRPAALFETDVIGRMPVARSKDRDTVFLCGHDVFVQNRDNAVAFMDAQRTAGTKIILQVDNKQSVTRFEFWGTHMSIIACVLR